MSVFRTAEIIAVGSELLTPFRADTNSLVLTARLNELGIDVRAKVIVGDDRPALAAVVRQALARADLVVTTGGLGPTEDDLTREVVADVLGVPLDEDAGIVQGLRERFAARGLAMPAINLRQAQVPRGAAVLANPTGTAPGLWMDVGERALVLLPGPPREMKAIVEAHVLPRLEARAGTRRVGRRVIGITGRTESAVDEVAEPIYTAMATWPIPIQTTILSPPAQIELHLSATSDDPEALARTLDRAAGMLAEALAPAVFSVDGHTLPEVVGELLRERGLTIAAAESCTGGLLLSRLVDVAGSSGWVVGGVTAYSNAVKVDMLGVPADLIAGMGAVSEPVAAAMAAGVKARLGADIGIGITGVAGPTGGTPSKPVGTVVVAVDGVEPLVKTFNIPGERQAVRLRATQAALDMVRRALLDGWQH